MKAINKHPFLHRCNNLRKKIRRGIGFSKKRKKSYNYIDIHIVEHCNLNCRGCAHFSPIAEKEYLSVKKLEDMYKTYGRICGKLFDSIHLLGGEPLLHPEIETIVELSRQYFPQKEIVITTNGLKIPLMPESFFEMCRANRIKIYVSKYPGQINYERVEQVLRKESIDYEIESWRDNFIHHVYDENGKQRPFKNYMDCEFGGTCLQFRDGKIFPCARAAYIGHLNHAFGTKFTYKKGDFLDLSKVRWKWQLLLFLILPKPFCRYCDLNKEHLEEWGKSERKKEEWF